ncbi:hypothetical protein [Intrasporangium sp.]|uniref:hypothetical protein n=1 Tax=Intrasporangium sp. TaxID=1925024 RepID=UPI0029399673|nr:hypothetical protein [Intrasporangium sp.]MDV3223459.1 hypothetical protein [Intrasporangium sp.]
MLTSPAVEDRVFVVHALGARLAVDLDGLPPVLVARFRHAWQHCAEPSAGGALAADEVDAGTLSLADRLGEPLVDANGDAHARLLMRATQSITKALIAAQAGRLIMLHAGALSHPDTGAAVVFVAPGGTGKTTLSRTFGHTLAYLTDETVAITADRGILPYPKPLSIRRTPHQGVKDELPASELGLVSPRVEPWVAGIIVLRRDAALDGVVVEELGALDAIVALAPETSSLTRLERPLHRLAELGEATGGYRLVRYAEAADLGPVLGEITGRLP